MSATENGVVTTTLPVGTTLDRYGIDTTYTYAYISAPGRSAPAALFRGCRLRASNHPAGFRIICAQLSCFPAALGYKTILNRLFRAPFN
jgi:hypothetical protein